MRTILMLCLILSTLPCFGATAYTSPSSFVSAVSAQNFRFTTSFDVSPVGSPANSNGMLSMSAVGNGVSGTSITLPLIAMNSLTPLSAPNTLGTSVGDAQFLAGNSDRITLTLSRPVNAVGLYLIGNPSPTGDPAIPFWKMHVNAGGGFDALSATVPYQQLGGGNDAYFIGVVSAQPFTTVDLYCDNDPSAVFSFNIDDITIAATVPQVSIRGAKDLSSGDVLISNVPVTRAHSDRFNIEMDNRLSGIAVLGSGGARGQNVTVWGTITETGDDEAALNLVHLLPMANSPAPNPLGMNNRLVGGASTMGTQIGVVGSMGLNNIGLDVTIWGRITAIDTASGWMTVDDGTKRSSGMGSTGVKVTGAGITAHHVGQDVVVTGSSSIYKTLTGHYPLVRVANPSDITNLN